MDWATNCYNIMITAVTPFTLKKYSISIGVQCQVEQKTMNVDDL